MKGLWLEHGELRLRTDLPAPRQAGEAQVRVLLAGICNTDLELRRGYYPFEGIPGHEFVGEFEGRRVVGEINAVCHQCDACRNDRSSHCERRTVLGIVGRNGAFAEYLALPRSNLHPVPDEITTEEAVFVEPLAAALEIQEQVRISAGDRVLVVGDGKLGQLVAQTLALTGCSLTVVGRHAAKLALLQSRGIRSMTDSQFNDGTSTRFDVAVECTGNASGLALARRALRPRGVLVLKSTYAGDLTMNASSLVVDEITLIGSRCGPFSRALQLLRDHAVEVAPLIHATYGLDDAMRAFEHAARRDALKVLLRCA